ncbi:MAG: KpsF/GutQ family sugar-phosphate isomerase [Casimicrobiaceae bacterium]
MTAYAETAATAEVPGARGAGPGTADADRALALARAVLATEASAITALASRLGDPFLAVVRLMLDCRGRVVVSGIGKSGHVARKIAATLASTGTPAFFVHPAEASHGDLGMITPQDVVLMLSNSGETDELVALTPHLKRQGARIVALTGNEQSSLAVAADLHLDAAVDAEACPLGLAPTASTTAALALGDALALVLLDARGFSVEDFARSHPGGSLGRRLFTHVADIMRSGAALPIVPVAATITEAVVEMSAKGLGMAVVVDADEQVVGVFTDGDLRRAVGRIRDLAGTAVGNVMTREPRSIAPGSLAIDCVEQMEKAPKVMQLVVQDAQRHLVGVVHMHDLFRARVV